MNPMQEFYLSMAIGCSFYFLNPRFLGDYKAWLAAAIGGAIWPVVLTVRSYRFWRKHA